jgi:hypothetical protein
MAMDTIAAGEAKQQTPSSISLPCRKTQAWKSRAEWRGFSMPVVSGR